jgi:excisionase family DNA binding protein
MPELGATIVLADDFASAVAAEIVPYLRAALSNHEDASTPWMCIERAARYLDVSVERIRKLKEAAAIPYYQENPRCRVFFHRDDLDAWMGQFRQSPHGGDA